MTAPAAALPGTSLSDNPGLLRPELLEPKTPLDEVRSILAYGKAPMAPDSVYRRCKRVKSRQQFAAIMAGLVKADEVRIIENEQCAWRFTYQYNARALHKPAPQQENEIAMARRNKQDILQGIMGTLKTGGPIGLTELSEQSGIAQSVLFRYLPGLIAEGCVERIDAKRYEFIKMPTGNEADPVKATRPAQTQQDKQDAAAQDRENIDQALDRMKLRLQHKIENLDKKMVMLTRLAEITEAEIAGVLLSIRADLSAIARQAQ